MNVFIKKELFFIIVVFSLCLALVGGGYILGRAERIERYEKTIANATSEFSKLAGSYDELERRNREIIQRNRSLTDTAESIAVVVGEAIDRTQRIKDSRTRIDVLIDAIETTIRSLENELGYDATKFTKATETD